MNDALKQIELLEKELLDCRAEVNDRLALSVFFGFIAGILFGFLITVIHFI